MAESLSITLKFPANRPGPAAVLRELLLHVRQPDLLSKQHDHRHEHGEQRTHITQRRIMTATQRRLVLPGWFPFLMHLVTSIQTS